MAGVAEENRQRIAAALVLAGCGLILTGLALVLQYRHRMEAAQSYVHQASTEQNVLLAHTIKRVLFWLLILVGVFSVSTFAFLRWSRRFRRWLLRKPRPPTPAEDLWARQDLAHAPTDSESPDAGNPGP